MDGAPRTVSHAAVRATGARRCGRVGATKAQVRSPTCLFRPPQEGPWACRVRCAIRRTATSASGGDAAVMPDRQDILNEVAAAILARPSAPVLKVGIDGVDGAGKTTLADELAARLAAAGRPPVRASVDGFHQPKAIRYQLGRRSPHGYFLHSYNYAQLTAVLLDPLSPGGSGRYRTAVFDHATDAPLALPEAHAVLVFDGI